MRTSTIGHEHHPIRPASQPYRVFDKDREPAYVKTVVGAEERPLTPLFFDINIERITGRRGSV